MEMPAVESNKTVQINWGTFNVPTLITVLGILWYTATHTERQDTRLDSMDSYKVAVDKRLDAIVAKVDKIDNLEYRITTSETKIEGNNAATNARIDRAADALQGIRDTLGTLSSNVLVINNKLDNAFPQKKSELTGPPVEYAGRN